MVAEEGELRLKWAGYGGSGRGRDMGQSCVYILNKIVGFL